MESVRTLSSTHAARKNKVRYTAYYPNSNRTEVLYSGSEQGYRAHSSNYEEMYLVSGGSLLQFANFRLNHPDQIVVHKENWTSDLRRRHETFSNKRSVGEYPTDQLYQTELISAPPKRGD